MKPLRRIRVIAVEPAIIVARLGKGDLIVPGVRQAQPVIVGLDFSIRLADLPGWKSDTGQRFSIVP
ncbi:MAG: hypothetical protein ACRD1R_09145 [Acidobacteriota bacterium]